MTGMSRLKESMRETAEGVRANILTLLRWRPSWRDAAEIMLLASALPVYYLVRGQVKERVGEAIGRGVDIVRFEQSLGIFWEPNLQRAVLDYHWFVDGLNYFYLFGHLPLIGALAVWLYIWHRQQYLIMRNAFLISGAIALFFYINFPTAPPRLLPDHLGFGLVDTVFDQYDTGRPYTFGGFVNEYAAFPSMHFGWNLLVGLAVWMATKNIFMRAFALLMPFGMLTDIVLTANHYILDPLAAIPVVALGVLITLAARWLVLRILSPDSKTAREKGWVKWVYWLVGVPEPDEGQPALNSRSRLGPA